MPNTLLTPSIIAADTLLRLENRLALCKNAHREFKKEFDKVGDTITIRKPVKYVAKKGETMVKQDTNEKSVTLTVSERAHVAVEFSLRELTLEIEDFGPRYLDGIARALSNKIESDGMLEYLRVPGVSGTAGTTPATFKSVTDVMEAMDLRAVPEDRCLLVEPKAYWGLIRSDLKDYYDAERARQLNQKGFLAEVGGMKIFQTQLIQSHTSGSHAGLGANTKVKTQPTDGDTSIVLKGFTASATGILKKGDVLNFGGCNSINPEHFGTTGVQQDFVVTDTSLDADANGEVTVNIFPAFRLPYSGAGAIGAETPYATVDALPAVDALVTSKTYHATARPQNLAFHKQGIAFVPIELEKPLGAAHAVQMKGDFISILLTCDYDITNSKNIWRFDVEYGWKVIYEELCQRLTG